MTSPLTSSAQDRGVWNMIEDITLKKSSQKHFLHTMVIHNFIFLEFFILIF
eukprot:c33728_g1_i1 orf=1-150(-)